VILVGQLVRLPGFEGATLEVERYAAPTGTDDYRGRPTVAAPTVLSLFIVHHQSSRRALQRLQLDQTRDWRSFYCESELRGIAAGQPDVVRLGGERWEIQTLGDYGELGGIWIAMGQRIE
jgi:hypothetical protein